MILIPILLAHLLLLANLRFEAWPEMLVYPYLLDHGFKLYQDIINPYAPIFTGFLYFFFKVFGLSLSNLKLLTWGIIFASDIIIYRIASRRYGHIAGLLALSFFVIFQPLLDGNGLWYDLALTPVLLLAFDRQSPFLVAVAFFMKQSVLWLFVILFKKWRQLLISLISLFLISYFLFLVSGNLAAYLFWPWHFALTIMPTMPGHKDWGTPGLWFMALIPFILPTLLWLRHRRFNSPEPFLWMSLSFLLILPRFGLFHLQPALAFTALVLAQHSRKIPKLFLACYIVISSFLWFRHIKLFWHQPTRFFEPEIMQAAEKLKSFTVPEKPILFLNAPDQIMILANRLPAKPWAITFPWYLELPGMQQRFIDALINQQVQAIVFSP